MKNLDEIFIIKNNGEKELYNADKIHKHITFACDGLNVSHSEIIMDARLKIFDGAKSSDIQNSLIQSAAEKISEDSPDYEIVAGRLLNQKIRKEVYGQYQPKDFFTCVLERTKNKIYSSDIIDNYTKDEIDYFGSLIDYELDNTLSYSSLNQLYSKYLIKRNNRAIETPQEIYMLIPMFMFCHAKKDRKKLIELGYKLLSQRKISLPTPIMNGVRTLQKNYISCNLINAGDSVKSLSKATSKILECTASKSGIGINVSHIRGLGANVGHPTRFKHTGILPLIKTFEAATGSLTQVGRGGSSNLNCAFYHYEVELFSQLGDSKGSIENRARHTDQTIIINKWFLKKALNQEDIYLFHMNEVPELYDVLGYEDRFDIIYQKYVSTVPDAHKKKINAWDLLNLFIYERSITGRLYFVFADNFKNSSFKENLYMTNLCCLAGDTVIETKDGLKKIKDIKINDYVLSYNEKTLKKEFKKVLNSLMTSSSREVLEIEYNGKKITCTPDHRFLTQRGYIEAQHLLENDEIIE